MTIGEKIRTERKRIGLTQTELGDRLGVKTNAVSKWECGRVEDIPTSKVKAMAALFDVPVSYLIDDELDALMKSVKEQDAKILALSQVLGHGITLTGKNNSELIFKDCFTTAECFQSEKALLIHVLQLNQSKKDHALRTLRILSELVSVMSPEDQDKLVSYAEFMEADRQKRLGISVQHPYQYEQE